MHILYSHLYANAAGATAGSSSRGLGNCWNLVAKRKPKPRSCCPLLRIISRQWVYESDTQQRLQETIASVEEASKIFNISLNYKFPQPSNITISVSLHLWVHKLSDFRIFKHSNLQTSKLLNCQTFTPSNLQVSKFLYLNIFQFCYLQTIKLRNVWIIVLRNFLIFRSPSFNLVNCLTSENVTLERMKLGTSKSITV